MPAGRPPKPVELKRAQGNPGKRPLPNLATVTSLPQVKAKPPKHLSKEMKKLWSAIRGQAVWIADTDQPLLELLCEKLDRREDLLNKLRASDFVLYTDKGYAYANPLVGMISTLEVEVAKLFSQLGLTPTDRTKLGVAEVKARSVLDDLMDKRQTAR